MTKKVELHMVSGEVTTLHLPVEAADRLPDELKRVWDERTGTRLAIVTPERTIVINLLYVETIEIS